MAVTLCLADVFSLRPCLVVSMLIYPHLFLKHGLLLSTFTTNLCAGRLLTPAKFEG